MTKEDILEYPWPGKKDFMEAVRVYLKLRNNEDVYKKEINAILYTPFKEKSSPSTLKKNTYNAI